MGKIAFRATYGLILDPEYGMLTEIMTGGDIGFDMIVHRDPDCPGLWKVTDRITGFRVDHGYSTSRRGAVRDAWERLTLEAHRRRLCIPELLEQLRSDIDIRVPAVR